MGILWCSSASTTNMAATLAYLQCAAAAAVLRPAVEGTFQTLTNNQEFLGNAVTHSLLGVGGGGGCSFS